MRKIFITGIGTDVGKTVVSAIVTEALNADYWKPVQAGELDYSDSDKVRDLISNTHTDIFDNSYGLKTPMSPHAAAEIDGIAIDINKIKIPHTSKDLIIEGAGGLLVPLNDDHTVLDLINSDYKVIVVSRHYLGSINHTLLTIEMLKHRNLTVSGIIFIGNEHIPTERIIEKQSGVHIIGRINEEEVITKSVVKKYATKLKTALEKL